MTNNSSIPIDSNKVKNIIRKVRNNPTARIIIYIVIIVISIIIIINVVIKSYNIYVEIKQRSPWLLYSTKDARDYIRVIQDKDDNPLKYIRPSSNRSGGLEFSYGCWIYIDNMEYNQGRWKHIFHKGSKKNIACPDASSDRSSQCPGLWLDKDTNHLHVYLNTFVVTDEQSVPTPQQLEPININKNNACAVVEVAAKICVATTSPGPTSTPGPVSGPASGTTNGNTLPTNPASDIISSNGNCAPIQSDGSNCMPVSSDQNIVEGEVIENIPVNNWLNVVIAVQQYNLDIYINGILVKRKLLKNLPMQNDGDFHINSSANGVSSGFAGYISNIKYWSYYLSEGELFKYVRTGPSSLPSADSIAVPPYLTEKWWLRQ